MVNKNDTEILITCNIAKLGVREDNCKYIINILIPQHVPTPNHWGSIGNNIHSNFNLHELYYTAVILQLGLFSGMYGLYVHNCAVD